MNASEKGFRYELNPDEPVSLDPPGLSYSAGTGKLEFK